MFDWLRRLVSAPEKAGRSAVACGAIEGLPTPPDQPTGNAGIKRLGNAFLGQGQLDEAAMHYRQVIALDPLDADAHLNLGFVLSEQKHYKEAEQVLLQALEINPAMSDAFYILGVVSKAQGDLASAIGHLVQALELKPDFEIIYGDLCQLLFQNGQNECAREYLLSGIALYPRRADFHFCLGNLSAAEGDIDRAISCFLKALSIQPGYAQVHNSLGHVFQVQGSLEAAIASYNNAILLEPDYAEAHSNLGTVFQAQGKLDEAISMYQKALSVTPHYAEVHLNLGLALQEQGKLEDAIAHYHKALLLKPDYAEAHFNLGYALRDLGRLEQCVDSYRSAVFYKADYAEAYTNLGGAFQASGDMEAAIASYKKALELNPDLYPAHSNLLYVLSFYFTCSPIQYLAEARHYGNKVAAQASPYSRWSGRSAAPSGPGNQRLRVGLVSGDLRAHPVGFFLESILGYLNSARIELVAYCTQSREDELTARIKPRFVAWNSIAGLNDKAAAQKIFNDSIDILIDLAGHTYHNRLGVFAWKPAPVQVSWLGYWASTGVPGVDYLLADRVSVPDCHREHFTETVWHLPDTRLCFAPPGSCAQLLPGPLPALRNGCITFGCFQNMSKVNHFVLAVWGRVFAALPDARLRVQSKQMSQASAREYFLQQLAQVGIAAHRVVIEGEMSREDYLAAHAEVDIILDTFPFPGGTTTCEALWMGVPTVTLIGNSLLARQGVSILTCAGLVDWVAADEDDYVARALNHAHDLDRLVKLRSGLRQQVLASPIFDARRFALHFEAALRGMWHKWCEQRRGGAA